MSAALLLLTQIAPLMIKLVEAGANAVELYDNVKRVFDENRIPGDPEWDSLEVIIDKYRATIHDKSLDG